MIVNPGMRDLFDLYNMNFSRAKQVNKRYPLKINKKTQGS